MRAALPVSILLLASMFVIVAPAASARIDVCSAIADACIPPGYFVNGCHVNGLAVRADAPTGGCTAQVYVCDFDYFGGSGSFLGNFVWHCTPLLG